MPWWKKESTKLRKEVRCLFNRADSLGHWKVCRRASTDYNKELMRWKRNSWEQMRCDHCYGRHVQEFLCNDHSNEIEKTEPGVYQQLQRKYQCAITDTLSWL